MVDELRRVTEPGKFEGCLAIDEWTHGLTLDGCCDEECGSVDESGWYGIIRGPLCKHEDAPQFDGERLTDAEVEFLATRAGAIVRVESQGFVSVAYYADPQTLEDTWAEVVAECTPADEDDTADWGE
jgi:hypothetical protein